MCRISGSIYGIHWVEESLKRMLMMLGCHHLQDNQVFCYRGYGDSFESINDGCKKQTTRESICLHLIPFFRC